MSAGGVCAMAGDTTKANASNSFFMISVSLGLLSPDVVLALIVHTIL